MSVLSSTYSAIPTMFFGSSLSGAMWPWQSGFMFNTSIHGTTLQGTMPTRLANAAIDDMAAFHINNVHSTMTGWKANLSIQDLMKVWRDNGAP